MSNDIVDVVIEAVASNLADLDYLRRRNVRMVLFAGGEGKAAWLAVRDDGDFEVSDVFPVTASADVSRWHKEQAYQAVREGHAVSVDEAQAEAQAADAARAAKVKPKKKSKAAVAA